MNITFSGKYKSITSFEWMDVPMFAVLTGPNGVGKSQLLELIYNTIINKQGSSERVSISNALIGSHEVSFLKGEWNLANTNSIDLVTQQQALTNHYNAFRQNRGQVQGEKTKLSHAFSEVINKTGKNHASITKEEFFQYFPSILIENENQLGQKIAEIFYNYRIDEIELKAEGVSDNGVLEQIGQKPWYVLREILKEGKLPFVFNDPSTNGIRDVFTLQMRNEITGDEIKLADLSSGEKVLMSLVFYLYNSQERNIFPKLLLLDEPDAHLHPAMSKQFINVVKNVLIDKFNVRVIMTTHSPSTVILVPEEFLFEVNKDSPRIKKPINKNNIISILTSGLVFVGEGTKYYLVEDNDDVSFYSYINDYLISESKISSDIPLVFIPASTKDKSGGKDVVQNWVSKLVDSGLGSVIGGLIDKDSGNVPGQGVFLLKRYSIENYLIDPVLVYVALMDKEKHYNIPGVKLRVGEEYKVKYMTNEELQLIADSVFAKLVPNLIDVFEDFNPTEETERISVEFINGVSLDYPRWLLDRRGKTLLNELYNKIFGSPTVNFSTLYKALRKTGFIPVELVSLLNTLRLPI